jgi:hypothetical protein
MPFDHEKLDVSAAVLDVCARLSLLPAPVCQGHEDVLERVSQMLTKLIRVHQAA